MAKDALHDRLLALAAGLPGAFEDRPWGSIHCKVDGKIFVGWGRHDDGRMRVGFKTDKELQSLLLASDPRFKMAAYVGKHGWVDMLVGDAPDWGELEHFILDSYKLIASKTRVKELAAKIPPAKKSETKLSTPKRPAAKKRAPATQRVAPKAGAKKPVSKPKKASKRAPR